MSRNRAHIEDKLVNNLAISLNEEQLFYLKHHLSEKRTKLAKKLGIPKVNLNHLLGLQEI